MAAKKADKWGYTIGVRHYLNDRLKGVALDEESTELSYPLYLQITAKGQSIKVKSVTGMYFTRDEFERYKAKNESDLRNEELLIRRDILEKKPFDNAEFSLVGYSLPTGHQGKYSDDLEYIASQYLYRMLSDVLDSYNDNMIRYELLWNRSRATGLPYRILTDEEYEQAKKRHLDLEEKFDGKLKIGRNPFDINPHFTNDSDYYSMYLSFFMPEVKRIRDMFPPEFWDFSGYVRKIYDEQIAVLLVLDDLLTGRFDSIFMATWNNEEALKAIRAGFDTLFSIFPELQERRRMIRESYDGK